ncbi:hypothetical protein DMH01_01520 [Amycolatopsis sp. WAC 04182]|uniref:hypothetical protein n=1 Tax=Amycolatopsis sp. WAC 04182 TaxID=2203198 RepID=UPI000F7A52C5|nr:hypothetical protein [Amycolatopsis sp. WAC 04182]RSN65106.1 hypothetical protein DMH01_01520 [Amycolatopsis sp. WAC 04182]
MDRRRKELWRRCRSLADGVTLPEPFDAGSFVAELAAERGRPIELMQVSVPSSGPCGLLMSTERADYILYPTNTTALHRRHILLHEVGHLLCGHVGSDAGADGIVLDAAAGKTLMPNLSPELVRRVLGRTGYSAVEEQEAELLASLLAQRVARTTVRGAARPDENGSDLAGGMARVDDLFGSRKRRLP